MIWLLVILALSASMLSCMGLFGIDSTHTTSTSTDSRTAGTDQAVVAHQGAIGEHPISVNSGVNANVNAVTQNEGSVGGNRIGGTSGGQSNVNTGISLQGSKDSAFTLQNVDADVVRSFGTTLADVLEAQGNSSKDQVQGIASIQSGLFNSLSDKIAALSESQQTGGDSDRNKIILYVVLAVLAVVGVLFWRRK